MASHVVVVGTTARRATVKTTPGKHLSDVLQEACATFNINADNYALKFNNKALDLSRTIRLANLPQGAKLDLVQASRSPSVVNVALQLEQPGQRLTHKFPSTTSLWQVLRVFETVSEQPLNLTQRGVAVTSAGSSGGGRLHYEIPVLDIMGREMGSFVDLQKTLAQLGFTGGSALLRLKFRDSGRPLEEAMTEISQYFQSMDAPEPAQTKDSEGAHGGDAGRFKSVPEASTAGPAGDVAGESNPPELSSAMEDVVPTTQEDTAPAPPPLTTESAPTASTTDPAAAPPSTITGPDHRPMLVYTPSTSTTPQAARTAYDESDYVPTVDHARTHQALLQTAGRNKRLASDAELAATEKAKADKLAAIDSVTIRVRLPDTSHVEARFGKLETAANLYDWVRGMLTHGDQPFTLKYSVARGLLALKEGSERLVSDLGFQGRQLVNLMWDESASAEARKQPSLKEEWRSKGQELTVPEPVAAAASDAPTGPAPNEGQKKKVSAEDKESKIKNILGKGLFGKKK